MQQKIHKILFLFLLLLMSGAAYADGADKCGCRMQREEPGPPPPHHGGKGCKFDFEQFRKDLTKHISTRAGFTAKEAQAFFPLFFEMKAKQRSYMRKTVRAYRRVEKEDLKEKECQKILREVENLESKKDEMERTYMQRLEKAVGAKKLMKALNADHEFGRKMFHNMAGRSRGALQNARP